MTEEVTTKKRSRRKRRSKAEIEAEKAAKLALEAEEAAKEAEGLEKVRARDEAGHFIAKTTRPPQKTKHGSGDRKKNLFFRKCRRRQETRRSCLSRCSRNL